MDQERRNQRGFTLIELLVAIVVVGILTAVAIVGIGGLTDTAKGASCQATMDAARAGVAAYYAANASTYPDTFAHMETQNDLTRQGGVQEPSGTTLADAATSPKWTITLGAGGSLV